MDYKCNTHFLQNVHFKKDKLQGGANFKNSGVEQG